MSETTDPICGLCGRPVPPDAPQSRHHLVPKLRGGKGGETVLLHQICHNAIHRELSETEIARHYASLSALRAHPALARFISWVQTKSPTFHAPTAGPRRGGRRR